ncbi:TPA: phage baseplate assembly protein V [Escherichia coli]|nr:phage baseplate assembly protein V [Escherichia coli]
MNVQLTEIMRLITNLIRTGVVTEVDRENWLCRVKTGELETNWISWLTLRAGNARTWWRPSEGEQVVLLSLGGNLETAFALPAIYSNQFAPPSTSADACVTEHPDGGWFEYEPATGRWYVRGIKSMVIEAADNITMKTSEFVLEADRTRINSEVVINGGVNGGVPSTGDINIIGGCGGDGQSGNIGVSGEGGTSYWGGGGRAGAGGGVSGKAYGSGGGGAYDAGYSGTSMTGGKGAAGICIIEEFA